MFDLTGKVALVTGAAGLLGSQFVEALLSHGAAVVAADIDESALERLRLRETIARQGERFQGIAVDIIQPNSVADLFRDAVDRFGRIDVLINNAAGKSADVRAFFTPFERYSLDIWREVMAVNLDAAFLCAQAAFNQFVSQGGGGSIINIASVYGVVASDNRIYEGSDYLGGPINNPAVYAASKGGVVNFSRWLACYGAKHGIRSNAIAPGGVESGQNQIFVERYSNRVPLGRMARPHEMTGAVLYLASDASSYMTGQTLVVDGGLTAW